MAAHLAKAQFIKFAVVGLCSNTVLYLLYICITFSGVAPKIAMSILYALGVLQTFIFNKKWTFRHLGGTRSPFVRYVVSYLFGYLVNIIALIVLVDWLKFAHQIVQGIMILTLACMMFILQKKWVFK